jgi:hypothetical protein
MQVTIKKTISVAGEATNNGNGLLLFLFVHNAGNAPGGQQR